MKDQDLKEKMKRLWKDTFHDSDEYINLIFENYFNPEFVEYTEENGKLVSALLGIPYNFYCGGKTLKGLYLCGLATLDNYRHKGIMSNQLSRINERSAEKGFALSFLIPSSDLNRIYYGNRGYHNSMYRVEERYTGVHDFRNELTELLSKEDDRIKLIRKKYYDNLNVESLDFNNHELLSNVVAFIEQSEKSANSYTVMLHSKKDILIMLEENLISGGRIYITRNQDNVVSGIAFVLLDDKKKCSVPKIYYENNYVYYKLLEKIKNVFSDSSMSVMRFPEQTERNVIWSPVYGASNPDGDGLGGSYGVMERVYNVARHAQPYGMSKLLNFSELLKFLSGLRRDVEFSILVKKTKISREGRLYEIRDGVYREKELRIDEVKKINNKELTILTEDELSELLLRKKDSSSLIMEAFGIPRLAFNMALLLD